MNCKEAEQAILLAETLELSGRKLRELESHLSACALCTQYQQSARQIMASAREALPTGEPSALVTARIRAAAAAAAAKPASTLALFRQPIVQALAYAAAVALVAGAWLWLSFSRHPATSINEFRAIMALVSETTPAAVEARDDSPREQELRALARELLLMEGLTGGETGETESEATGPTSDAEPAPTVLRSRSIVVYPLPLCG